MTLDGGIAAEIGPFCGWNSDSDGGDSHEGSYSSHTIADQTCKLASLEMKHVFELACRTTIAWMSTAQVEPTSVQPTGTFWC